MIIIQDDCKTYLFCLWKKSKQYWKQIEKILLSNYKLIIKTKAIFPDNINFLHKFYNNEDLVYGYEKKLNDIKGEMVILVLEDNNVNQIEKLINIKKKLRDFSKEKNDYNFIHSSQNNKEFLNQIELLKGIL